MAEDADEIKYWITSVGTEQLVGHWNPMSPERRLATLLAKGWYFFAANTPGRKRMKAGDRICFYLKRIGIAAEAELGESSLWVPRELEHFKAAKFQYPFQLGNPRTFFDHPVVIDTNLRSRLDAFKGRNVAHWQWFVQMTHNLTRHDFLLLTASGTIPQCGNSSRV